MTTPAMEPILEITGLSHVYDNETCGIHNINLTLNQGEYLILAGPNGSGKTTLIRHMNGLLKPGTGQIRLQGHDIFKDLTHTRTRIGMVFQDADTQIVGETVFAEAAFGPENLGMPGPVIRETVTAILAQFGLDPFRDRHPSTLSGGEKRKLTIAGILVMDPDIIIFDEPFANLDYPAALELTRIISRLNTSGKTIVMATHDLDFAAPWAHRMVIMENGTIAAHGPVHSIAPALGRYGLKPLCTCHPASISA